jgi:hypothetical protein
MASTGPKITYRPPAQGEMISRRSPILGSSRAGVPQIGHVVGFMDLLSHLE